MFFGITSNNIRPPTPVPSFILTDTSSTIENSDAVSTPLTKSLDERLSHLQETVGESHPDVVHALSALGDACLTNEDHEEALRYYTQALEVGKKTFPVGHPSVSAEQGDKANAIKNYNSALALQMQELGEDHPSVAVTLHNIGTMHYRSQEFHYALKSYKQVLKMRRYLLGNEHISIAECLLNIATVHEKAGEFERCQSALNAAIRITAKHHGAQSVQCAHITQLIGALNARSECDEVALEYYDKALELYGEVGLDDDHASVQSVHNGIAYIKNKNQDDTSVLDLINNMFNDSCGGLWYTEDTKTSVWNGSGVTSNGVASEHGASNASAVMV